MNKNTALLAALGAVALIVVFLFVTGDPPSSTSSGPEPDATPAPEPTAAPDELAERLALLRQEAEVLQEADRDLFNSHARELADEALQARRPDISAGVGRALADSGDLELAGAILQRAVGLMKPGEHPKDHLYALATVRREQGRPIEAATLYERAVHAPPTLPAEFVGLSEHYLAADREGPARAAVTRGLREHTNDRLLRVQGAEVEMLTGKVDLALTQLETLLQDDPTDLDARILRIEAMLAVSEFDAAAQEAAALRDEYPDDAWGWILGAAAERVRGRPALEWVERADELASDCTCKRTEQRAVAWVRTVGQGPRVLPRSRVDISEEVDLRAP